MNIKVKRVYDPLEPSDGDRLLVDRLWPRGLRKNDLHAADWAKDLAPSTELRRLYHAKRIPWDEFQAAYRAELGSNPQLPLAVARLAGSQTITLLTAASDRDRNHALVLCNFLLDHFAPTRHGP